MAGWLMNKSYYNPKKVKTRDEFGGEAPLWFWNQSRKKGDCFRY